jgi:hypothetical protein
MHMDTFVVAFRPPDEEYFRMKALYEESMAVASNSCSQPDLPDDVIKCFCCMGEPDDAGAEVVLGDALQEWEGFMSEGYEIHIDKLPKDVRVVRFINSWA